MSMQHVPHNGEDDILSQVDRIDTDVERVEVSAVALLNRSEVEAQITAAHQHRRSIRRFLQEAMALATISQQVAESCLYALPRGGKVISGPSVRLAEIVASAYGNLHIAARIVDVEESNVVAQGVAWDLEKNVRVTVEMRRKITNKAGKRYDEDMITMTGNAAASIAFRNAIFRVVPRAYVNGIYEKARLVAVGDATTFAAKRADVVARLQKIGVPIERIFARCAKPGIEDITQEDLEQLIGLGTAIKEGNTSIDDAFPALAAVAPLPPAQDGKRIKLGDKAKAGAVPHDKDGVVDEAAQRKAKEDADAEAALAGREPGADG